MDDYTSVMRDLEAFQSQLDKIFKRVNTAPIFETETQLREAVSDNVRYFADDRKKDLAEILYAIFDLIYDRIVKQDTRQSFCNPQVPAENAETPRLPEFDMFRRVIMPLSWAMNEKWPREEFAHTVDAYTMVFTEAEAKIIRQSLDFLVDLFPEFQCRETSDVLQYWKELDENRESMREETDEEKSWLLGLLMERHAAFKNKKA